MRLSKRLETLEKRIGSYEALPVLIVDSEEAIKDYKDKIGAKTVIIIDDIPEDEAI